MEKRFVLTATLSLLLASNANAAPMFETYTSYRHTVGTTTSTIFDAHGPAAPSPALDAEVTTTNGATLDWNEDAHATATVNGLGYGRVKVDGVLFSPEASDPFANPDQLYSSITMTDSYTNSGTGAETLSYGFFLDSIDLAIGDWAGAGDSSPFYGGEPIVEYGLNIIGNGSTLWTSSATLRGGVISHTLTESGEDLGGTFYSDFGGNLFGYTFDPYATTLDLGILNPGETMDLLAEMWVSVTTAPFELGGRAGFLDPGSLTGWNGTAIMAQAVSPPPPGVPAPATVLLIGAGVIGLSGLKLKRRMQT